MIPDETSQILPKYLCNRHCDLIGLHPYNLFTQHSMIFALLYSPCRCVFQNKMENLVIES